MNEQHFSARAVTKIALCVAFCCVTAWFSFPLPFTPGLVTALTMALGLAAFVLTPKEREAMDAAKAKLAMRIQKQPDEFWAEEMTAKERLGKLSEGLLQNIGGAF